MYSTPIYFSLNIYKLSYSLIYFNKKKNIWLVLNIPNIWNKNVLICDVLTQSVLMYYIKVINKSFCYENGFKSIYLDRWAGYSSTRYNLILDLFNL